MDSAVHEHPGDAAVGDDDPIGVRRSLAIGLHDSWTVVRWAMRWGDVGVTLQLRVQSPLWSDRPRLHNTLA